MSTRMPVLFIGHGSPMNALLDNEWTQAWTKLGASLPRPRAILMVSAHWYLPGTRVTAMQSPRTIHDFGGFPPELYALQYPAPGEPQLARDVQKLLAPTRVTLDESWGLDHGCWSVLRFLFPGAEVPVVQLSIDDTQTAACHYQLAHRLVALRDDGVLIVGSGDLVHNLHAYAWGGHPAEPYDWALRFEARARELIERREYAPLIDYATLGRDALLSVPTPEHYLPLLYVLAQTQASDTIDFPVAGIDGGSVSMLSLRIG